MKSTLSVSCSQLKSLSHALTAWVAAKQAIVAGSNLRVTPLEVLAMKPIVNVSTRVEGLLMRRALHIGPPPKNPNLNVNMSLPELLAVYYCLPWEAEVSELTPLLGNIQQLLLNYDQYVLLT